MGEVPPLVAAWIFYHKTNGQRKNVDFSGVGVLKTVEKPRKIRICYG